MIQCDTETFEHLVAGVSAVIPREELKAKLALHKQLVVKLGADPTSPNLHLGHAIVLMKMRAFQQLGHKVVFLIGDFTARIGDPTGRSKTRPPLSEEQIIENSQTYLEQVSRIICPESVIIKYNSEWLRDISLDEWIKICSKLTLARLTEREDFAQRIATQQSIGFHELLYPILQGYDSVALHADVELGGTDQTFNLLVGRFLQEHYGQQPQVVMTMPLLEGLDGTLKMSKSYDNAIGLTEPADQAFGKLMSISDKLMWRYYELLLHYSSQAVVDMQAAVVCNEAHPMELKKKLALKVVEQFWGRGVAEASLHVFEELFQKKDFTHAQPIILSQLTSNKLWIVDLLKEVTACATSSEARRLVLAGAVAVNSTKVTNVQEQIDVQPGMTIKVGKHRFYKIV